MTAPSKFATAKEAREAGWFSRRNKTRESHLDSKAMREEKLLKKQEDAKTRARSAVNRSAQEQLFILDYRLGEGLGAVKERARLTAFI